MPHAITRCYLPPSRGDIPALTPAEAGTGTCVSPSPQKKRHCLDDVIGMNIVFIFYRKREKERKKTHSLMHSAIKRLNPSIGFDMDLIWMVAMLSQQRTIFYKRLILCTGMLASKAVGL